VNQGNSGGALINTAGELIGINSAIASPTGAYAGYSYAIPVNLVKKVVNDLMKYGNVQRAYLGIYYQDPTSIPEERWAEAGIRRDIVGVTVTGVQETGSAAAAGIKKGDVITGINGIETPSIPQMTEQIARYKPGDKISISYMRNDKSYTTSTILKNADGNTDIVKTNVLDALGADLITLDKADAAKLGIRGGVYVDNISGGILKKQTNMKQSFIILKAGGQPVNSVEDLRRILDKQKKVQVEGVYPELNGVYYYNIDLANGAEF